MMLSETGVLYLGVFESLGSLQCAVDKEPDPGRCQGAACAVSEHHMIPPLGLEPEFKLSLAHLASTKRAHSNHAACARNANALQDFFIGANRICQEQETMSHTDEQGQDKREAQ